MTTLSCQRVGEMSRGGLLAPRSLPQQDGALKIKAASILNLAGILTTCPMPPRIQQWGESARACDGILLLVTCRRRGGGGGRGTWRLADGAAEEESRTGLEDLGLQAARARSRACSRV